MTSSFWHMLIQKVLNTDPKLFVEIIVGHQNSCNYKGWHITPYLEVFKFYLSSLAYSGYIVHRKRKQMFVIPSSKLTIFPILFLFFGIITSTEWTSSVVAWEFNPFWNPRLKTSSFGTSFQISWPRGDSRRCWKRATKIYRSKDGDLRGLWGIQCWLNVVEL